MIVEYTIDYRSHTQLYEKIFLDLVAHYGYDGKITKDHFILKCYVVFENVEQFQIFADDFSAKLPHSIFLYSVEVNLVDVLPSKNFELTNKQKESSFCFNCLREVMDDNSKNYYNIFKSCNLCDCGIKGDNKNYIKEFENIALDIKNQKNIKLNTSYGTFTVGLLSNIKDKIDFDVIAYDCATIMKYTNVEEYELKALASIEKPFIKLKKQLNFTIAFENITAELIRFKLPDDFVLHLLLEELHKLDINLIFITKDDISIQKEFCVCEVLEEKEPIEIVVSKNSVAIIKGDKGLQKFPTSDTKKIVPAIGAFNSILSEHKIDLPTTAGIYLSKKYQNNILINGKKHGTLNYLSLNFEFSSIKEIFTQIQNTNDTGIKIVENYNKKYPEHFEKISKIHFTKKEFTIYELWGLIAIILDFTDSCDIKKASKVLEENTMIFLGKKGPKIDYKLLKKDSLTYLDPLMIIRSSMSFKLAGMDNLSLSYGIVESFVEFLSTELDNLKETMDVEAVAISGSLLENKKLFAKLDADCSLNHKLYFNNELLVDEKNIFCKVDHLFRFV